MKHFTEFRKTVETGVDPLPLFPWESNYYPRIDSPKICLLSTHHDYIKPIKRGSPCSVIAKRRQLLGQFRLQMIILRKLRELGEFFEQHLLNQEELIFCRLNLVDYKINYPLNFFRWTAKVAAGPSDVACSEL